MSQDQTDGGGSGTAPTGAELPEYAERVLDVADLIPPGRVMTYGDIAEWLGEGGPRQVGRVMALYGSAVPWWRVVRSDGTLLPAHELRALDHYRAEGTPCVRRRTGRRGTSRASTCGAPAGTAAGRRMPHPTKGAVRARKLTPDSIRHRPPADTARRGSARDEGRSAAAASHAAAGVASSSRGTLRPPPSSCSTAPTRPSTPAHPRTPTRTGDPREFLLHPAQSAP